MTIDDEEADGTDESVMKRVSCRAFVGFTLRALLPPASYSAVSFAVDVYLTGSNFSILLFLSASSLPLYALFYRCRKGHHFANGPAIASVVGHFATVFLTYLVKFTPVMSAGLNMSFLASSAILGSLLVRVSSSDPGCVPVQFLETDGIPVKHHPFEANNDHAQGYHTKESSQQREEIWRGKYCTYCHSFIEYYDHHCAALQNCIGSKNHFLFLLLLLSLIWTETLYLVCSFAYIKESLIMQRWEKNDILAVISEIFLGETWVFSTAVFVALQIFWQMPFLIFQLYLVVHGLTMDEWVHWYEYPRLYRVSHLAGQCHQIKQFVNPYDKGPVENLRSLLHNWR